VVVAHARCLEFDGLEYRVVHRICQFAGEHSDTGGYAVGRTEGECE
jgi:hypothetical protein